MTKRRRARGEGTVYQTKDGRWRAVVSLGVGADGRRRRKYLSADTKGEVLQEKKKFESNPFVSAQQAHRWSTEKYLDEWYKTKEPELRPATAKRYRDVVRLYIVPHLGLVRLGDLRPAHVQALITELHKHSSKRAPSMAWEVLRASMRDAVALGYIPASPLGSLRAPKRPRREYATLSEAELRRFFELARTDRFYALFVLAAQTGARKGELLALRWSDVDLRQGVLRIRKSLSEVDGDHTVEDTKTAGSRRELRIPAVALEALKAHRKRQLREGKIGAPVFCDRKGGWVRVSNFHRRHWAPLLKAAGLDGRGLRFHDLRHTMATLLLRRRVDAKTIASLLGHSDVRTTLTVYAHLLDGPADVVGEIDSMTAAPSAEKGTKA